jgi:hypothetical protein
MTLKRKLFLLLFTLFSVHLFAQKVSGEVKDLQGKHIPHASIIIKGSSIGTSANDKGDFALTLRAGNYTIVCQAIGYMKMEKQIAILDKDVSVNFILENQQYKLNDVTVKKGEDPAYAIMRNAIKQRETHLNELEMFEANVYTKGKSLLRDYPPSFLKRFPEFADVDSTKRIILFLCEIFAKYSKGNDGQKKLVVTNSKISGRSELYVFAEPKIISFYESNVSVGSQLPRGLISPLANIAFASYRFKYEGSFVEDGKLINRIKVTPKRKYEPLVNGIINIVEDDWRIHSVDFEVYKENQLQGILDTFSIHQLYVPINDKIWVPKLQLLKIAGRFFKFDFYGEIVQVYDQYNMSPTFQPDFFDDIVVKFEKGSNKQTLAHLDSIRPMPLLAEESRDYKKKDSIEILKHTPHYADSVDRVANKIKILKTLLFGQSFTNSLKRQKIYFSSPFEMISYNTVEGAVLDISPKYTKRLADVGRESFFIQPHLRYGFGNKHFNASVKANYIFGNGYKKEVSLDFGKRVFQFNNENPISLGLNTYYTLYEKMNFLKTYEAWFFRLAYNKGFSRGFTIETKLKWQDRSPLVNVDTVYAWASLPERRFTDNYPKLISAAPMLPNKSLTASIGFSWQIGAKYIQVPEGVFTFNNRYPTIRFQFTYGIPSILDSDADFAKWNLSFQNEHNLKMLGTLNYHTVVGGFLNNRRVNIPDFQHYNDNETYRASTYLNSFQLAPFYQFSNTDPLYLRGHIEWQLNGFLTNKIPLFKMLNSFLVTGVNGLWINKNSYYGDFFVGLTNVLGARIDYVISTSSFRKYDSGLRIGVSVPIDRLIDNDD